MVKVRKELDDQHPKISKICRALYGLKIIKEFLETKIHLIDVNAKKMWLFTGPSEI